MSVKIIYLLVALVVVILVASPGLGFDTRVTLEISAADQRPSLSSSADWGWWHPGKYADAWFPDDDSSLGLADARMLVAGDAYTVVLAGEWYPTLDAVGTFSVPDSSEPVAQQLQMKTAIYDLGFGRWFGRDARNGALPWIGATYMDISETLVTEAPPDSSTTSSSDRANAGLWGVAVGVDGSITVWESLDVTGRLLFRWATGTRSAWIDPQDPAGGSQGGEVKVSDSIDHMMWGLDVGVRWHASRAIWLEAGWRLRDRTLDGGPARFGGPQIKAAFQF